MVATKYLFQAFKEIFELCLAENLIETQPTPSSARRMLKKGDRTNNIHFLKDYFLDYSQTTNQDHDFNLWVTQKLNVSFQIKPEDINDLKKVTVQWFIEIAMLISLAILSKDDVPPVLEHFKQNSYSLDLSRLKLQDNATGCSYFLSHFSSHNKFTASFLMCMTGLTIAASCGVVGLIIESIIKGTTVGAFGYSASSSVSTWLQYLSPVPLVVGTAGLFTCFYSCVSTYRHTHQPLSFARKFQASDFTLLMDELKRNESIFIKAMRLNQFNTINLTIEKAINTVLENKRISAQIAVITENSPLLAGDSSEA